MFLFYTFLLHKNRKINYYKIYENIFNYTFRYYLQSYREEKDTISLSRIIKYFPFIIYVQQ